MVLPRQQAKHEQFAEEQMKHNLNMGSKVLINAIDTSGANSEVLSLGYYLQNEDALTIDKSKLVKEFSEVFRSNFANDVAYKEAQRHIPAMLLTYGDRYYLAKIKMSDGDSKSLDSYKIQYSWSAPMYYTVTDDSGRLLYLNMRYDTSTYYSGEKATLVKNSEVMVGGKTLTPTVRDHLIIDKINTTVGQVTTDPLDDSASFKINIRARGEFDKEPTDKSQVQAYREQLRYGSNFNVLEGITYFVLYSSDKNGYLRDKVFRYRNYNAAGFTLVGRY